MICKAIFVGRLTRDPQLQQSRNNKPYVMFTVAFTSSYNRTTSDTTFLPCMAWNTTAESMAKYLSKGSLVAVEAGISSYRPEGEQREKIIFQAREVQFLDNRRSENNRSNYNEFKRFGNNNYNANKTSGKPSSNLKTTNKTEYNQPYQSGNSLHENSGFEKPQPVYTPQSSVSPTENTTDSHETGEDKQKNENDQSNINNNNKQGLGIVWDV